MSNMSQQEEARRIQEVEAIKKMAESVGQQGQLREIATNLGKIAVALEKIANKS